MLINDKPLQDEKRYSIFSDFSLWSLLLVNIITIFVALIQNWSLLNIMWVYWSQSIIIGFFTFIKIRRKCSDKYLPVISFGLYLFGHLIYLIFLIVARESSLSQQMGDIKNIFSLMITILAFFINHLFSFFYNRKEIIETNNADILISMLLLRVLPIHLSIILGCIFPRMLLIFLVIKTIIDASMHIIQHRLFNKSDFD